MASAGAADGSLPGAARAAQPLVLQADNTVRSQGSQGIRWAVFLMLTPLG